MAEYLIIGASSGIGAALAEMLVAEGHQVTGTGKNKLPEISGLKQYLYDVHQESIPEGMIPEKLDGLVFCPGSISLKPFNRIKPEEFLSDLQLQIAGAVKVLQASYASLARGEQSSVVLFSSLAAGTGLKFHTLVSSTKGAIEGFARALAAEWAPQIRVNVVAPSLTDTRLASALLNTTEKRNANAARHPLKRIGSPQDIAETAKFLLKPQSSWMSGQVLHVDGGLSSLQL
jgi:NAD(P)-dependent dehydrogenase (short-subunit alcohol dehydrogenase family)